MKKLNKLGFDLSSYKPTATQTKAKHHSYKEVFNSPACKKWAKNMKKMYKDEYCVSFWDAIVFANGLHHKQNIAKPIELTPSRKKGKIMKIVYEYKKHNILLDEDVYHHIKKWKKEHNMKDFSEVVEYLMNYEETAKNKK